MVRAAVVSERAQGLEFGGGVCLRGGFPGRQMSGASLVEEKARVSKQGGSR